MRHQLMLMRNGKSDRGAGGAASDRPLSEHGRLGVQRVAAWMDAQGLVPEHVVSSTAVRARETVDAACKTMGRNIQDVRFDERAGAGTAGELVAVLADCPDQVKRVLLIGHNPGLERLIAFLADVSGETPRGGKLLPTAAVALLEVDRQWSALDAGCGRLISVTRPSEVPDRFPAPGGEEGHTVDRPAYYYTQSAVIPYRLRAGRLEVLIIASRKGKHWVVPKGIKEPELSPAESAAKEALEEAGVRGRVGVESLGSYDYEKWGGVCSVEVFPMKVTDVLDDAGWKERHRKRRWVAAAEAQHLLKPRALADMIGRLAADPGS